MGVTFLHVCKFLSTERILACRSPLKEYIDFWNKNLQSENGNKADLVLLSYLKVYMSEIFVAHLCNDSTEVVITISVYIAKKLHKRSKCDM